MGSEKQRKIDIEVKDIHTRIRKSNLVLKQRLEDVQNELKELGFYGDSNVQDEGSSL